jgi:hypothetical protein
MQAGMSCANWLRYHVAGKAKYDVKKHALVWKIKRFTGGPTSEHLLIANVELIATTRDKKAWSRPPINMSFQVCAPLSPSSCTSLFKPCL